MPIYQFQCAKCGHDFEHMTRISARDAKTPCPACGSVKTGRTLTAPAVHDGSPKASSAKPARAHPGGCGCCARRPSCPMQNG